MRDILNQETGLGCLIILIIIISSFSRPGNCINQIRPCFPKPHTVRRHIRDARVMQRLNQRLYSERGSMHAVPSTHRRWRRCRCRAAWRCCRRRRWSSRRRTESRPRSWWDDSRMCSPEYCWWVLKHRTAAETHNQLPRDQPGLLR